MLQNKFTIEYVSTTSLSKIDENIKRVYTERKKLLKIAESLSLEYRTKLALAKEEAGEVKDDTYIKSLNRIEGQRRLFSNIRVMEQKIKGGSTSKVVITSSSGEIKEYTDKKSIEKVIAPCNGKTGIRLKTVVSSITINSLLS